VLVAVLLVTVGMIGFLSLNDRKAPVTDVGYEAPRVTTSTPTATTTPDETTTTTTPLPPRSRADTPTQNTSRQAPRPVNTLGDNPLFTGENGTPEIACELAAWESTPQAAAAFFTSALPCLNAAWEPVMTRAGLPFHPPGLEFPDGSDWSSPCGAVAGGSGAVAAFYCGENNTLYMPFAGLQTEMYGPHPGVYLAVLAHEYGHHVQSMSGVLDAYAQARYEAGVDTEAGLELSRRLELQAQCLSGMFFAATYARGSVDDVVLDEARTSQDRGDHNPNSPRDHGTDAHTSAWWEQGAQKNRTFQCNTWLAPAGDVG
jgi:uncharacterized protein